MDSLHTSPYNELDLVTRSPYYETPSVFCVYSVFYYEIFFSQSAPPPVSGNGTLTSGPPRLHDAGAKSIDPSHLVKPNLLAIN